MAAARSPRGRARHVRRVILCVGGLALAGGLACKGAPRDLVSPSEQAPADAGADAAYDFDEEAGEVDLAGGGGSSPEPTRAADDLADDLATYERLLVEQELRLRGAGVELEGTTAVADATTAGGGRAKPAGDVAGGVIAPRQDSPKPSPGRSATTKSPTKKSSKSKRPSAGGYGAGSGAGMGPAPAAEPVEAEDRCATICDLAAATCDLQDKICDLADRHPGEERYSQVCARATSDCARAREACEACPV